MKLAPVIGLEIHVQLKTDTKMFCRCSNRGEDAPPNTTVCPVCMGHPGALPVVNRHAVEFGVLTGLAVGGHVAESSKFDRKNYFYPDLPKGYQISQFDLPVVSGGSVTVSVPDGRGGRYEKTVHLHRAHLEEDAAKLMHAPDGSASYVDYNRGGTPLVEIVTEPDIATPAEAKAFLQELRLIMRYLGVSDADMEKGHLRCDANISLREVPENPAGEEWASILNPKTEVKNINSFRSVERALEYEIKRQTKLWLDGKMPTEQTTRGWDDAKGITVEQRSKEEANDYRYFPEPDLPPMRLMEMAEEMRRRVPELPTARRERYAEEFGLTDDDARTFVEDKELGEFAERVFSELSEWVSTSEPEKAATPEERRAEYARLVSGWLLSKLGGVMTELGLHSLKETKLDPENFAELLSLIHGKKVTGQNALLILTEMCRSGADPSVIMEEQNLGQIEDDSELTAAVGNAIAGNPKAIEDWRAGKANAVMFLVGQVMKMTRGKANPEKAKAAIEEELRKLG
jgi:aspartyl-tRNA(Asn)/glutamyl-tRNA(Gln) amidotransferase subunit B